MKKMVAMTLVVIMLTMLVLAAGTHVATQSFVDPALKDLNRAVAAIQPEAQQQIMPHLARLQQLRNMGGFYVLPILFLAGLLATLILWPLLRRSVNRLSGTRGERPKVAEAHIGAKKERPKETVGDDPIQIGACRILSILQNKGRLIDFLEEDITSYPDAQIGTAVRSIHEDCGKALHEYVTLAPVMFEREGETVVVPERFDPSEIRLTGQITGGPPFEGTLQHPGWKVTGLNLPDYPKGQKHRVIAQAEVEIGQINEG
jgi:hypothetical protein